MVDHITRRALARSLGLSATLWPLTHVSLAAQRAPEEAPALIPTGAGGLRSLAIRVAQAPRRRDFQTVPMILTRPDEWDAEALSELLGYLDGPRQVWNNTDIGGPWLNLMRNAINAQIWSWKHPDFLCVSATHGTAHLALFDDLIWDKYRLSLLTQGRFRTNQLSGTWPGTIPNAGDIQDADGPFSPAGNSIAVLQQRGVAFIACHNAIWEISASLMEAKVNPDSLDHGQMAAELTNHLLPGVILSPGVVATIPELQHAGFLYTS